MSDDKIPEPSEIVIVRRRGGDDMAAGKGGAWKIAYADFVTAMMAFFLVMWLINASNEETRAQVASYFNPIKLTDNSTGERGLKDSKESKSQQKEEGTGTLEGSKPPASDTRHEAELMADPEKVLEKIEAKAAEAKAHEGAAAQQPPDTVRGASTQKESLAPGVGDPFDPKAWDEVPPAPPPSDKPAEVAEAPEKDPEAAAPAPAPKPESVAAAPQEAPEPEDKEAKLPEAAEKTEQAAVPEKKEAVGEPDAKAQAAEKAAADAKAAAVAEAATIAEDLAQLLGTGLDQLPASIDVKSTDEGTLISLTDNQSFGMFKTGSSEPEPEMLRLVEAIAKVLGSRPGYIVVRGHTDARPYRNKRYDNWQLSTARAHFAQYMLVRGGLEAGRIHRIEGLADRELKNPADPQAPENRRIEILLGQDKP